MDRILTSNVASTGPASRATHQPAGIPALLTSLAPGLPRWLRAGSVRRQLHEERREAGHAFALP